MEKRILWLLPFALSSCWVCPNPVYIEHNNMNNTIEVLSEGFYIKSITITEFIPKDGSIDLIDSSKILIEQHGARGATILNYTNSVEHYNLKGEKINDFIMKDNLHYEVKLMKFENKKKGNSFDVEVIDFIKDNSYIKKKYNSTHPCP